MYSVDCTHMIAISENGGHERDDIDVATYSYNWDFTANLEFCLNFKDLNKTVNVTRPILIPFSDYLQRYDLKNIVEIGTVLDWDFDCSDSDFLESKEIIDFIEEYCDSILDKIKKGEIAAKYFHY